MKALRIALLCALFISGSVLAGTAELFQVPYDTSAGVYRVEDYHMAWYISPYNGYHMGEDWNRVPLQNENGSVDEGDQLNALASGRVIYVNQTGLTGKGKVVIVRYTLPTGSTVDGVYYHCKTIVVNYNDTVTKGQKIAELGGTGGVGPHLHWQMETDPSLSVNTNPYHGNQQPGGPTRDPMTPANALRYTSPSLFVDDRSRTELKLILGLQLTTFYVNDYAPSSTAFFKINGGIDSLSIKRAADLGYIQPYGVVWKGTDGQWYCYSNGSGGCDVMKVRFEPGVQYGVWLNSGNATFTLMPPGHNFKDDRARIDMIRAANQDSRYNSPVPAGNPYGACAGCNVATESFAPYYPGDSTYDYRQMAFLFTRSDGTVGGAYFYHATNVANPLVRYYKKYNIDTATWSSWTQVDRNTLY